MPKPHISQANEITRSHFQSKLDQTAVTAPDGRFITHCAAYGWRSAAQYAWTSGYDVDAPPSPATAELERLVAESSPLTNEFRRSHVIELDEECKATRAWQAMRPWSRQPSEQERAKVARLEREQVAKELEIERRTFELVSNAEEKKFQAARKQAEKELGS